ncbi:DUF1642 domain-containing protein [Pediococcus pentosaceus]|uniref:DUF1642 domain-containing protein n=1 Tax=Pediococcus pentosaceus TaxID=1255 RepID=UPI003F25E7FA
MNKVKVPAVFDKWYKQLKQLENKNELCDASEAAMFLISAQGHGYSAAGERNIMKFDFDLTGYEQNEMLYYIHNNKVEAIRAILDGYEVEKKLYHIIFPGFNDEYLNYSKATKRMWLDDEEEQGHIKTKFTMDFIEEELPQYKQFAVEA